MYTHTHTHSHSHTLSPLLLFAPDPEPVPLADAVEEKEEDWEDLRHSLGLCGGRGDTLPGEGRKEGRKEGGECEGVEGTQTYSHKNTHRIEKKFIRLNKKQKHTHTPDEAEE